MAGAGVLLRALDTGRFLFLKNPRGRWEIPGGHVDVGERPKQAALRELVEETGFHGRLVMGVDAIVVDHYWFYCADVTREFVPDLSDEHVAYSWAALENAPEPLHPVLDALLLRT